MCWQSAGWLKILGSHVSSSGHLFLALCCPSPQTGMTKKQVGQSSEPTPRLPTLAAIAVARSDVWLKCANFIIAKTLLGNTGFFSNFALSSICTKGSALHNRGEHYNKRGLCSNLIEHYYCYQVSRNNMTHWLILYRGPGKGLYVVGRKICSCSWLTALPGPAWVLLSRIYKSFPVPLLVLR